MSDAAHPPLIRADATPEAVRALTAPPRQPPRDPVVARLEAELAVLQARLSASERDSAEAMEAAREAGRKASEAAYQARDDEALARLQAALQDAATRFGAKLSELEVFALDINRTALAQMFSPFQDLAELSARAIALQCEALRESTIVELRVSAADFASMASIAVLRQRLGTDAPIHIDPSLIAGDARFTLNSGGVELSLGAHRSALDALFARATPP